MSYSDIVKYHMDSCNILLLQKFIDELKRLGENTLLISKSQITVEAYLSLQKKEQLESSIMNYIINSIGDLCAARVEYTTDFYLKNGGLEDFLNLAEKSKTEIIFIPVFCNNHYSLAVYHVMENILDYLDPAENSIVPEKIYTIVEIISKVFQKPLFKKNNNIPRQKQGSMDCGIITCWYIKTIFQNKQLSTISSVNTDAIRKHFLLEIKNIVYNNTGGDLSKLDEVWTFEEDLDVIERIDKVDNTKVVQNGLLPSENCKVKTDIEIVDSILVKAEQEIGNDSKNKKLENDPSPQLLHNPLEIMNSNLDKVLEEEVIDKIEEIFEKNQTYYGANVDKNNKTCVDILETIPVNLLDTLYLQDKLDFLETQLNNNTEDEVNKILLAKFEKDRQCTFIQLRNLPAVLRKLSSDKEESWKLLENVIKLKPIIALSLVARAKYPSHAPHRFHYGNRKCFLRFKNIVERNLPGMLVNDPKAN